MSGSSHQAFYGREIDSLRAAVERVARERHLPDEASGRADLEDLLVRLRGTG
jgi:hypothetical protein